MAKKGRPVKGSREPTRRSQRLRKSVLSNSTKNVVEQQQVLEKGGSLDQVHANIGPTTDEVTGSTASALDFPQESMEIEEGCTMANEQPVVQIETPASTSASAVSNLILSSASDTISGETNGTNQDVTYKSNRVTYNMILDEPHKFWDITAEDLTDQLDAEVADGRDPTDFHYKTDEPAIVAFKKTEENYRRDKNEWTRKTIKKCLKNEKFLDRMKKAANEKLEVMKSLLDPSGALHQTCEEATADFNETVRRLLKGKIISTNSSTGLRRLPNNDWELNETDPKFKRFPKKMKLMLNEAGALKEPDSA